MIDSTNLRPPFFGPEWPIYPVIDHIARTYGAPAFVAAFNGRNTYVYNAFIQQWNPTLQLRDREAVYVWEPNGNILVPGYYDCRLMSNYNQLPLLVTWCCGGPRASASLSSSSSS